MLLTTQRLEIHPLAATNIASFVAYRQVPEIARYQSWGTDYSLADAEALVGQQPASGIPEPGEWVQLGLHRVASLDGPAVLIGDVAVGADPVQPDTYELGVTLAPEHQGSGYAAEALIAVIQWLMRDQHAHRVHMQGDARNVAVLALMGRLGLRHEGTLREGDWFKGEWTTLERYAILRSEWLSESG